MRNAVKVSFLVVLGLFAVSVPVLAHHGTAGLDMQKTITVKGTVTAWLWANPHTFLRFDAQDAQGVVIHWNAEWMAPSTLVAYGVNAKTFKVGDEVSVTMTGIAKNGASVGRFIQAVLPSGEVVRQPANGPDAGANGYGAKP